jgi:hypothetical protein
VKVVVKLEYRNKALKRERTKLEAREKQLKEVREAEK